VLDVETADRNHSICQIGLVVVKNN